MLLKHEFWDHEIFFIPNKTLLFKFLYKHSAKELKFLKKYLAKQLKIRIIQKLISLAVSFMLFVPKKNEEFQLCMDYQKLNEIIIKN